MVSTTRFALQVLITFGFFETTLAQKDIPGATFPIYEVGDSIYNAASPDSISKNYIDIIIKKERKAEELSICELRNLLLEQMLIERVESQLFFNEQVRIGDKVYLIKFTYNGKFYSNYVVCSAESKKVIVDYFFKGIMIEPD